MTSIFKATTSAQHRALLKGLALAGYIVADASRPNVENCVEVHHAYARASDVETTVRSIDPNAERL